jgi:hypothetical protein
VDARLGPALETLDALLAEGVPQFDLCFIDADKRGYSDYFDRAMRLVRFWPQCAAQHAVSASLTNDACRCVWAA